MRSTVALRALAVVAATIGASGAVAQTSPSSHAASLPLTLAPVVVKGVVPGPALWKVSKDGHVMWVLGIISPLPKDIRWDSNAVDRLIAASRRVLKLPGYSLYLNSGSGSDIVQALERAKELPPGETLRQVLPPDLYSRWIMAKDKYLHGPQGWGVDKLKPILAATKLYDAALDQSNLSASGRVEEAVYAAARKHWVPVATTEYVLEIKDPDKRLNRFAQASVQGGECVRSTLDDIDHNFPQATALANAWATGDLATLRVLLSGSRHDPCFSDFSEMWGVNDMSERIQRAWLVAARKALANDVQSVALLPMSDVMKSNGVLDVLKKDGYTVEAPAALDATTAVP